MGYKHSGVRCSGLRDSLRACVRISPSGLVLGDLLSEKKITMNILLHVWSISDYVKRHWSADQVFPITDELKDY